MHAWLNSETWNRYFSLEFIIENILNSVDDEDDDECYMAFYP